MIYVVFIVFAVIVIFIININNTKSKEDANKQYFSESIKSYENFNPTYIKYGLDSEYIFAIDEHAKMLLYHRVNTEPVFLRYGQTNEKYKENSRKSSTADRKPITYSRASNFGSQNEM